MPRSKKTPKKEKEDKEAKASPKKAIKKASTEKAEKKSKRRGSKGKGKEGEEGGKRRKKPDYSSYNRYLFKVLKQVHPDIGITVKAMNIMDSFVKDMFDRIAMQSGRLAQHNKKKTLGSRETVAAIKLIVPGQLSGHAISEGTKALQSFSESVHVSQQQ